MILYGFIAGLIFSLILTPAVRALAKRLGVLDVPDADRKRHAAPVPLLGGIALFFSITLGVLLTRNQLLGGFLLPKHLAGILAGGLILVIGGALDDRYRLKPIVQLAFPAAAALAIIASGIGIDYVTNPFGGVFRLDSLHFHLFSAGGTPYQLTLPGDLFTFVWLMLIMYTTKLLDGLDGLVSGLGVIGATVLALLSLTSEVGQPELARLAMIAAGACGGFLLYNVRPASIFLGEGGSTLVGYLLGVFAILSGAKIGITLLIVAVPLMDVLWTVFRRFALERSPVTRGDAGHLHFRLVALGLSPGAAVIVLWLFAAGFGGAGLFLRGRQKAMALILLAAVFVAVSLLMRRYQKTETADA